MPNWVLGSGIPCRLCGLDAMATAKTWCSHLKEPRLRRVSAQNARVTPITEHEVPLGYPYIGCPMKKKLLLVLLGISIVFAVLAICASMQVRATPDERARTLAGDDLIPQPIGSVNHAITIRRPRHDVWPWLAQMGSDTKFWLTGICISAIIEVWRSSKTGKSWIRFPNTRTCCPPWEPNRACESCNLLLCCASRRACGR